MKELINSWKAEEQIAHMHGWDFSHIGGRYTEDTNFPWDYRQVIGAYLTPEKKLLDIDTGGGEFLLSLGHPYENTAATENYPPNVQLCKETLLPLGIDFRQADGNGGLPYPDNSFDVVIDRHGDFNPAEIYRVLKSGGVFLSQQVGAENDRELVMLLCDDRLLVKVLPSTVKLLPDAPKEQPYPGAKEMLLVEFVEDRACMKTLFEAMYTELPEPKKRK